MAFRDVDIVVVNAIFLVVLTPLILTKSLFLFVIHMVYVIAARGGSFSTDENGGKTIDITTIVAYGIGDIILAPFRTQMFIERYIIHANPVVFSFHGIELERHQGFDDFMTFIKQKDDDCTFTVDIVQDEVERNSMPSQIPSVTMVSPRKRDQLKYYFTGTIDLTSELSLQPKHYLEDSFMVALINVLALSEITIAGYNPPVANFPNYPPQLALKMLFEVITKKIVPVQKTLLPLILPVQGTTFFQAFCHVHMTPIESFNLVMFVKIFCKNYSWQHDYRLIQQRSEIGPASLDDSCLVSAVSTIIGNLT